MPGSLQALQVTLGTLNCRISHPQAASLEFPPLPAWDSPCPSAHCTLDSPRENRTGQTIKLEAEAVGLLWAGDHTVVRGPSHIQLETEAQGRDGLGMTMHSWASAL